MIDPREFPCMDDDPRNNGNGYNTPNPYDNYDDRNEDHDEENEPETDDEFDNENDI